MVGFKSLKIRKIRDAFKKELTSGHRPKWGEGVLAKSQILINKQFGTLLDRRGVSKVHVPKFVTFHF